MRKLRLDRERLHDIGSGALSDVVAGAPEPITQWYNVWSCPLGECVPPITGPIPPRS